MGDVASIESFLIFVGMVVLVAVLFTVGQWQWFRWQRVRDVRRTTRHAKRSARPMNMIEPQFVDPYTVSDPFQYRYRRLDDDSFYSDDTVPVPIPSQYSRYCRYE
ncbi:hypothetical protein EI42_01367 [Thermosporothrix hazakensis]|jgi:hypothetical protein|uniref:Uncharacterized protein n=2 Tax=Thermosporothrix TaxID=768650 RepID=A0A326UBS4_THEHA|nr:hypothetical protein [Thermosporothrix hazakensis]PZW32825.1 hypothetical protein EI42_01367 [Thermosporothrix hazakensis]BBH90806.1 hypothetical protein KTC_55570 [Thermosporothrix sp. COM3]GCE48856.1 hypothetical protein KTH_37250 [Thermosporothrix hazakensis]